MFLNNFFFGFFENVTNSDAILKERKSRYWLNCFIVDRIPTLQLGSLKHIHMLAVYWLGVVIFRRGVAAWSTVWSWLPVLMVALQVFDQKHFRKPSKALEIKSHKLFSTMNSKFLHWAPFSLHPVLAWRMEQTPYGFIHSQFTILIATLWCANWPGEIRT